MLIPKVSVAVWTARVPTSFFVPPHGVRQRPCRRHTPCRLREIGTADVSTRLSSPLKSLFLVKGLSIKGEPPTETETLMKSELHQKLEELAFKRSKPFCYGCYREAPTGTCKTCGSDDLMRLVPGVGCEYGTDWVIKHILETELEQVDLDAAFEDSVRQCYPRPPRSAGWRWTLWTR